VPYWRLGSPSGIEIRKNKRRDGAIVTRPTIKRLGGVWLVSDAEWVLHE